MQVPPPDADRRKRELLVLRALCQGTAQGPVKQSARHILSGYRWIEPLHQVVYDVVLALPFDSPELIREQLPSRLTRAGFPDVDVEALFKAHGFSQEAAEELMRSLRG